MGLHLVWPILPLHLHSKAFLCFNLQSQGSVSRSENYAQCLLGKTDSYSVDRVGPSDSLP